MSSFNGGDHLTEFVLVQVKRRARSDSDDEYLKKSSSRTSRSSKRRVSDISYAEQQVKYASLTAISFFDWNFLIWSPYFWCSCLLLLGFLGIFITCFVSLLQVENQISKGWILWIFTIIQVGLLVLLTFMYGYNRLTKYYARFSVHSIGRLNYSIFYMWIVCIFSVASLFSFITNPAVPPCCTNDIPGLTFAPYDINLFVLWYINAVLICIFNFGGMMACLVGIYNVMYPEHQIETKTAVHKLEKNSLNPRRDDKL